MPTHNDNTNNYVESSFRETKDNQFERTKCFNLPDLLRTLLDHSEAYKIKLTDLGNKRTANYTYNKSRYVATETNITKEHINNINGGNYIVKEERNGIDKFYRLNMYSGFCECSKGKNCGPCSHKNAVAYHFNEAGFSVIPESDPHMRALWHYIAFGQTLDNHWYRGLHDDKIVDVETFISERLEDENETSNEESEVFYEVEPDHLEEESDFEEESQKHITKGIIEEFQENWKKYGQQIVLQLSNGNPDPELKKAVKSANKILKKSLNSKAQTLAKQLVWFGKEQHCKIVRGRKRAKINVQPTAIARSKANGTARRGRKMIPKGRPHKSQEDVLNLSDGLQIPAQKKLKQKKPRAKHSFKESLAKNKPPARRHDKQ